MWGTFGLPWPVRAEKHSIKTWEFHRLRRQVRALTRSRALTHIRKGEAAGDPKLIRQGKATLRYLGNLSRISDPVRSALFPISEWAPIAVTSAMLEGIWINFEPPPRPHRMDVKEEQLRDGTWNPASPDQDEPLRGVDPSWGELPY